MSFNRCPLAQRVVVRGSHWLLEGHEEANNVPNTYRYSWLYISGIPGSHFIYIFLF